MLAYFHKNGTLGPHIDPLKSLSSFILISLDVYPFHPFSKWIYLIFWKVISLSLSVIMTKTVVPTPSSYFAIVVKLFSSSLCWWLLVILFLDYQILFQIQFIMWWAFDILYFMMIILWFQLLMMISSWFIITCVFLWILTPYLHVYGVRFCFCMTFLMWLKKGVIVTY